MLKYAIRFDRRTQRAIEANRSFQRPAPSRFLRALFAEYGPEQPVKLAGNSVREIKRVRISIVAADAELEAPQAARRDAAGVDRIVPWRFPLVGSKGLISLWPYLKLPTSR
jgi:hypothetical protein